MARISQDDTSWRASGLKRKYDTIEEDRQVGPKPKRKKDTKRWCRGIEGRRHDIQSIQIVGFNENCHTRKPCGHWRHYVEKCVICGYEITLKAYHQIELAEQWCDKGHLWDWQTYSRKWYRDQVWEHQVCLMCGKEGKSRRKKEG